MDYDVTAMPWLLLPRWNSSGWASYISRFGPQTVHDHQVVVSSNRAKCGRLWVAYAFRRAVLSRWWHSTWPRGWCHGLLDLQWRKADVDKRLKHFDGPTWLDLRWRFPFLEPRPLNASHLLLPPPLAVPQQLFPAQEPSLPGGSARLSAVSAKDVGLQSQL